jgi:hypothetical protein
LHITMGCERTIRHVHAITRKGSVHPVPGGPRTNKAWMWVCDGRRAKRLVQEILPFLITKLAEAEIALQFLSLPVTPHRNRCGRFIAADHDLVLRRSLLWDEMRCAKPRSRFRKTSAEDEVVSAVLKGWRYGNQYNHGVAARRQRALPQI